MHPTLLDLGPFHLQTYGACIAVGFLLCWRLIEGLSGRRDLSNLLVALMLSGVVGGRAAYVIEHWSAEFAVHPWDVVRVDRGGLVFYGGLILAVAVFFAWCRIRRERLAALADLLCAVIPLGHAFGRMGCFFYGCCYGRLSASPLAVCFPMRSPAWHEQLAAGLIPPTAQCALPVLPTQLIEAAALLGLFAVTVALYRRLYRREADATGRAVPHGAVAGVYLMGYALLRFGLEYLRGDPRAAVGPLSIAQTISLGIFTLGAVFLVLSRTAARRA